MDLGIRGRRAIVCASSKGLGLACARSLAREGVDLVMLARGREVLEAAAADIRAETGVRVVTVAVDITTPEGRAAVLAQCPDASSTSRRAPSRCRSKSWGCRTARAAG